MSDLSFDLKQTSLVVQEQNLIQHALGLFAISHPHVFHKENDHKDIRLFITHPSYLLGLNRFIMKQTFSTPQE